MDEGTEEEADEEEGISLWNCDRGNYKCCLYDVVCKMLSARCCLHDVVCTTIVLTMLSKRDFLFPNRNLAKKLPQFFSSLNVAHEICPPVVQRSFGQTDKRPIKLPSKKKIFPPFQTIPLQLTGKNFGRTPYSSFEQ